MTNTIQKFKVVSTVFIVGVGLIGCSTIPDEVSLTPPSADYRPTGIEAPNFPNGSVANPPLSNSLPTSIINNPLTQEDEDIHSSKLSEPLIPNNPNLTPSNVIELQATGTGVAPQNAISPAQSTALAKRAAMIDAYKLLGEKMYGVKLNGQDTVENMAITSSTVKSKVQALVRGADIVNVDCKSGLCQVTMELKLDGRVWYRALGGR